MWEKDRQILSAFKECFANIHTQMEAGEDVDLSGACIEETEALVSYTQAQIAYFKNKTPQELSEKKQKYYNPKVPYFQNL